MPQKFKYKVTAPGIVFEGKEYEVGEEIVLTKEEASSFSGQTQMVDIADAPAPEGDATPATPDAGADQPAGGEGDTTLPPGGEATPQ